MATSILITLKSGYSSNFLSLSLFHVCINKYNQISNGILEQQVNFPADSKYLININPLGDRFGFMGELLSKSTFFGGRGGDVYLGFALAGAMRGVGGFRGRAGGVLGGLQSPCRITFFGLFVFRGVFFRGECGTVKYI